VYKCMISNKAVAVKAIKVFRNQATDGEDDTMIAMRRVCSLHELIGSMLFSTVLNYRPNIAR
jgi:hypothetical protein